MENKLKSNLYSGADDRILMVGDFVNLANAEIEEFFPADFLVMAIARYLRGRMDAEEDFDEVVEYGRTIVVQVKEYTEKHGVELELGWKVEVAKAATSRLLGKQDPIKTEEDLVEI